MQAPCAPASRGCPSRQQTDLNAIVRVALLLLLLANVCRMPFSCYSPDESPDISDTAEPCYLHGEAFCWFPCRYFSLTHPAKYGEPGGRLIARRRQCTHVTCLQLHGSEGSATFPGADGRITPGFAALYHSTLPACCTPSLVAEMVSPYTGSIYLITLPPHQRFQPPRQQRADGVMRDLCEAGLLRAAGRPPGAGGAPGGQSPFAFLYGWEVILPALTVLIKQA